MGRPSGPGPHDDGGVVWLTEPDGKPLPPRRPPAGGRPGTSAVLGIALVAALVAGASLYDESRRWEAQATAAVRERDDVSRQLASAETRIAQLEDVLDRTERARWETTIQRAEVMDSVSEAVDSCARGVKAAASFRTSGRVDFPDAGGSLQEADEACRQAASAHDALPE